MSGPPPTPTALKLLRGNPGKRRINRREPKPEPSAIDPPAWLVGDPRALTIWNEEAPRLIALGLLGTIDRLAFAALCERAATYQRAAEHMRDDPTTEVRPDLIQVAPYVTIARGALAGLDKLWGRFGMTPADRSRLTTAPEEKGKGRWVGLAT